MNTVGHTLLGVVSPLMSIFGVKRREAVQHIAAQSLRRAVAKGIYVKQFGDTEKELAVIVAPLIEGQVRDISNGLKELEVEKAHSDTARSLIGQVVDHKRWKAELVDAILPLLVVKMAEAAVAEITQYGVDLRQARKSA